MLDLTLYHRQKKNCNQGLQVCILTYLRDCELEFSLRCCQLFMCHTISFSVRLSCRFADPPGCTRPISGCIWYVAPRSRNEWGANWCCRGCGLCCRATQHVTSDECRCCGRCGCVWPFTHGEWKRVTFHICVRPSVASQK